jgi:GNAT superfamily N-acetyltransferase
MKVLFKMRLLNSLRNQLGDTFNIFKEEGGRAGFTKLAATLKRILYVQRQRIVLARELSETTPEAELPPGFTLQEVKAKEIINRMTSFVETTDAARFHKMFDKGSTAFLLLRNDQTAGWGWISYEIDAETNHTQAPLRAGDACLHDLYVLPEYRGQGLAQFIIDSRLQFLREQGYKRSVISCSVWDTPALRVAEKVGYIPIGESSHVRFLLWDRYTYKPSEVEKRYHYV